MQRLTDIAKRAPRYGTWYHIVETLLPYGQSRVVATVCSKTTAEALIAEQKKIVHHTVVYSIDPAPISEPLRRCDLCTCPR